MAEKLATVSRLALRPPFRETVRHFDQYVLIEVCERPALHRALHRWPAFPCLEELIGWHYPIRQPFGDLAEKRHPPHIVSDDMLAENVPERSSHSIAAVFQECSYNRQVSRLAIVTTPKRPLD
jgi:hypothetical protein